MSGAPSTEDGVQPGLRALVALAKADGVLSPVEVMCIEHAMEGFELDEAERQRVRELLEEGTPAPSLPTRTELPDPETRRSVFERTVEVAMSDLDLDPQERELLQEFARVLELDDAEAAELLSRHGAE